MIRGPVASVFQPARTREYLPGRCERAEAAGYPPATRILRFQKFIENTRQMEWMATESTPTVKSLPFHHSTSHFCRSVAR